MTAAGKKAVYPGIMIPTRWRLLLGANKVHALYVRALNVNFSIFCALLHHTSLTIQMSVLDYTLSTQVVTSKLLNLYFCCNNLCHIIPFYPERTTCNLQKL